MHEVSAFEAKNNLAALLDEVERGDEVLITRRGKPVARLLPVTSRCDREKTRRAADQLLQARQGVTLGDLRIKHLVDDGRP